MLAANQCNTIVVEVRDVYGVSKVYPVCGEAQIFAAIAGTKTLRPEDIKHIKMLGYEIQIKQPEVNI
jgi:histidinol dehydrogenase